MYKWSHPIVFCVAQSFIHATPPVAVYYEFDHSWRVGDQVRGPLYYHGLTLIPARTSNFIQFIVWDNITYPFPNFNGGAVGVWKWISKFVQHFTGHVRIKINHVSERAPLPSYQHGSRRWDYDMYNDHIKCFCVIKSITHTQNRMTV